MTAIILLIACSLIVAAAFLAGFLWSVKDGQFDDTYTPSMRMLFDNELKNGTEEQHNATPSNHESSEDISNQTPFHP